jgi:hypothetical protein
MFRDANRPGQVLMDTLGLHAGVSGCADLLLRPTGTPSRRLPVRLARYVFGGGAIDDGHTVQGLESTGVWRVTHREAMVGPERLVLDIDPG